MVVVNLLAVDIEEDRVEDLVADLGYLEDRQFNIHNTLG